MLTLQTSITYISPPYPISDKEYDIIIDKENCFICLDYGMCGYYTISEISIPKEYVVENRALCCCSNDFILENMKLSFLHDFNIRRPVQNRIQEEQKKIGDLISSLWDDDKNKFIENIQYLKQEDYPLYLYLYWIKKDDAIHNKYQAYMYAMNWIQTEQK